MCIRKVLEKCRDQTRPEIVLIGPLFTLASSDIFSSFMTRKDFSVKAFEALEAGASGEVEHRHFVFKKFLINSKNCKIQVAAELTFKKRYSYGF
jgi:hypothetical protein